ncbi:MAG: hypothetical protein RL722_1876 [Pseudomonadota bacterium]|jgi:uncharacterized protein YbjT (DUF2867 family)
MSASRRTVILAGATGLIGRELLNGLLADPAVAEVHALVRRPLPAGARPPSSAARLVEHGVDFAALPALPAADEVYLALGTTIKVAGSQAAFRAVDFDANLAVARAAQAAGARRAGLVSAMGANARSSVFYNRVKGELEEALAPLGFEALVIARPSLLIGDRAALGQPVRPGERQGERLARWLGPLVPRHYRPITAARVARALRGQLPQARGVVRLMSGDMNHD